MSDRLERPGHFDRQLETLDRALRDKYAIEGEIGRGGMATVYRARDLRHERLVAVKVFHRELAAIVGPSRFLREIKVTARLQHPHILTLIDSGQESGVMYYVMPYAQGESLRAWMKRERQLPLLDVIRVLQNVGGALGYAHDVGIVHRDIKPENILIQQGQAIVADFGIAMVLDGVPDDRLTATGFSIGTPGYMSPEQITGEARLDGRTDIYALGCMLYEMLTGEPPFPGNSAQAIVAKHLTDPAPSVNRIRADVPQRIDAAIQGAMSKAPGDRFDSMSSLVRACSERRSDIGHIGQIRSADEKSIVVLPFQNLSPDQDTDYFSDGLTDEITADLSKVRALRVITGSAAMLLRGVERDVRSVGSALKVRYVLDGRVRRAGNDLRITVQLIDTTDRSQVWAEKFSGTLDSVFDMQESVSRAIVDALQVTLTKEEDRKIRERPIVNLAAYECYLRARQELPRFTEEAFGRAVQYITDGLTMGGENALLYGTLGQAHYNYYNIGVKPDPETLSKVAECADKVFALDPRSPQGHLLNALFYTKTDWRIACPHYREALRNDPNDPEVLFWYGLVLSDMGKCEAATPLIERLITIDPLTPIYQAMPGWIAHMDGRLSESLGPYRRMYELDPESYFSKTALGIELAANGLTEEACALLDAAALQDPGGTWGTYSRFLSRSLRGDREGAMAAASSSLLHWGETDAQYSWMIAGCYALVGEVDMSMEFVENAVKMGFINYPLLNEHDPLLERLRSEKRFRDLMVGVKEEWETFMP